MNPLSYRQIAMLRHIRASGCDLKRLRAANQITLWSLLHRGLVRRSGDDVILTSAGTDVLEQYASNRLPVRKRPADLSERCTHLLKASRVLHMKRSNAA